jgi:hypothetical protein
MNRIIILIFVLLIFFIFGINSSKKEGFFTTNRVRETDAFSWFNDPMFLILNYFENDPDGLTGWAKCRLVCPGNCVEYGPSGHSFCFDKESENVLRFPTFRDKTVSGGFSGTPSKYQVSNT